MRALYKTDDEYLAQEMRVRRAFLGIVYDKENLITTNLSLLPSPANKSPYMGFLVSQLLSHQGRYTEAQAYAYTPDLDTPTTWKLRLWQDLENKVTRRQLGLAAAALSPGGVRGQRVQIPATDLSAVKRTIRSAYRTLGEDEEEMLRWSQ